jgi:two-component system nitrogen regulation response regulator GlnG/two-component system response regulator HydG
MTKTTAAGWALPWESGPGAAAPETLALSIAWCLEEPERVGEVARIGKTEILGRADPGADDVPLGFSRERPSGTTGDAPLRDARLSRRQLQLTPLEDGRLTVENIGKSPLLVNGVETTSAVVGHGDTLSIRNVVVLCASLRGAPEPLGAYPARLAFPFGEADTHGIVGETPSAWRLRDEIALAAGASGHVLVFGKSGSGKELVARALHALSPRSGHAMITRNAATFPEGLIDAELFGNVKNYPNPGMPERRGLIGDSHDSTLFLDEIGELTLELQAHLLRVLDSGGEYQRLGESKTSKADVRVVAATNRDPAELKHDFLARFATRVHVPPLTERREDIPLLVRHILRRLCAEQPATARFWDSGSRGVRIEPSLIEGLVRHEYTHETRELERLLWLAISNSPQNFIALAGPVRSELRLGAATPQADPAEIDRERIVAALQDSQGNVTRAARALGLKNRFSLYRLMKRHGIEETKSEEPGET